MQPECVCGSVLSLVLTRQPAELDCGAPANSEPSNTHLSNSHGPYGLQVSTHCFCSWLCDLQNSAQGRTPEPKPCTQAVQEGTDCKLLLTLQTYAARLCLLKAFTLWPSQCNTQSYDNCLTQLQGPHLAHNLHNLTSQTLTAFIACYVLCGALLGD